MIHGEDEVLGVDNNPDKVTNAQYILTQVYQADAMNREALEQIRIHDLEHALISVGDSIAASVMISMYLKELGVPKVWVKAIHRDHEKLLHKVGADEVIIPEYMAAKQTASRIAMPGFIEYLSFDEKMAVKEFSEFETLGWKKFQRIKPYKHLRHSSHRRAQKRGQSVSLHTKSR